MGKVVAAALVPGLPHLLHPHLNAGYGRLNQAMQEVRAQFKTLGVERIVYFSSQWISVLGLSVQARELSSGVHVDENWYELGDLPFSMRGDPAFAQAFCEEIKKDGLQIRAIDYDHFPVDTGTIVADRLLNDGCVTSMVSCHVYSDLARTRDLGKKVAAIAAQQKGYTAVVGVSLLSARYFTKEVAFAADKISDAKDDAFNKRVVESAVSGNLSALHTLQDTEAMHHKADMQLKALSFLEGAGAFASPTKKECLALDALYGCGGAVLSFTF